VKYTHSIALLVLLIIVGHSMPAQAWSNPGHMAVAGLAYNELTAAEKKKLVAILRKHPDLSLLQSGFPSGVIGDEELVMSMATWPDMAKQNYTYTQTHNPADQYASNGYEEHDPPISKITFDHMMHKGWHFVDYPYWMSLEPNPGLPPTPDVNAVGVADVLIVQLMSSESTRKKAYDLGWLMHLVGDLHQPLHAISGCTPELPGGDTGGNDIVLESNTNSAGYKPAYKELHAYWDDLAGSSAKGHNLAADFFTARAYMEAVQNDPITVPHADDLDPYDWAVESFYEAVNDAYAWDYVQKMTFHQVQKTIDGQPQMVMQGFINLDDAYYVTAAADARVRIRLAGHRLALQLKKILAKH